MSCTCESSFTFQISKWRGCIQPAPTQPVALPPPMILTLDPSYTANETSDCSSIGVGFIEEDSSALTVTDLYSGKLKGIALPDKVVDFIEKWKPVEIRVEKNPFFDLLADTIKLKANLRDVEIGRITPFRPIQSKKHRILRLRDLLTDPPAVYIYQNSFVNQLLEQAEKFCFTDKQNHRHEDGLLDVVSMLAGYR
jgi:hypothetical protein